MEAIKKWVLNLKFVKDETNSSMNLFISKREDIYRKAFDDARRDLEETLVYDTDNKATELMEKRLNDMLSPVDMNFIVSVKKLQNGGGTILIGGESVEDSRLANLKAEADAITNFDIWKLIYETPKELAQRAMFVSSESLDDMKKGKSILYTLSTQQNIIDTLKSFVSRK